jgi:flagellar protein FlaG
MSDFNVSLSSSGVVGMEAEKLSPQGVNRQDTEKVKAEPETKEVTAEDVKAAVQEANAFMQNMQRNLSFSVDEELGEPIISVKDIETDEVIRQIPSEELVVLRKKMDDLTGILFDAKV